MVTGIVAAAVTAAVAGPLAVMGITSRTDLERTNPSSNGEGRQAVGLAMQEEQDIGRLRAGVTAASSEFVYFVEGQYAFDDPQTATRFARTRGIDSPSQMVPAGDWNGVMLTDLELGDGRAAFVIVHNDTLLYASPRLRQLYGPGQDWFHLQGRTSSGTRWVHPPGAEPLLLLCTGGRVTTEWKFGEGLLADVARPPTDGPGELCYFRTQDQLAAADAGIVLQTLATAGGVIGGVGAVTMAITGGLAIAVDRYRRRLQTAARADVPVLMDPGSGSGLFGGITEEVNHSLTRARMSVEQQRTFVADAAHELRSPLTSLITTLEVADRHPGIVDPQQVTRTSLTQARRLERLTQDLLLLAQVDARARLREDVVDLADVVREVVTDTPDQGRPIELTGVVATPVIGDREAFRRVLRNLVDNAVRHATSRVEVTLSTADGRARIEVANDGTPIPEAEAERIFDRFTRLDDARARDVGGSGLGLAIARGVTERYGGTVAVLPGRRDGATFVWQLPIAR